MRKLLEDITERLRSFIGQRDDFALVVAGSGTDGLLILKILEGLAEASTSELFWTSVDDFTKVSTYAQAVVDGFAVKHEAIRLTQEKQGLPAWPVLPANVTSAKTQPPERLRELLTFSRGLMPSQEGVTVWSFFPSEIADHQAFSSLFRDILRHEFPFPWCHHLRLIIWEDAALKPLRKLLADAPRIQWFQLDLSPQAIERALEAEAADESLPVDQRMGSLLLLAALDCTYKRFPDAIEKFEILHTYHKADGNDPLTAVALNALGEVYKRMGDLEKAGQFFDQALEPASASMAPSPIFLNVLLNLGALRAEQKRWEESESFYDSADQMAMLTRNPAGKFLALEERGVAQYQQRKVKEAVQTWTEGADLAEKLGERDRCRSILKRLEKHYQDARHGGELEKVRKQMAKMASPAKEEARQI
jgi:tetratricopeptide (TPR) repeat protein